MLVLGGWPLGRGKGETPLFVGQNFKVHKPGALGKSVGKTFSPFHKEYAIYA